MSVRSKGAFDVAAAMSRANADLSLRAALDKALGLVRRKRDAVLQELPSVEEARNLASASRRFAVDNLGALLEQFEARLLAGGVAVHWAADAADARTILTGLAEQHSVKKAVFAKSMLAEELELERALTEAGVKVFQTDLGERVVQLAGQKPSHMTAPCLHMSAADIGHLFEQKLGTPFTNDPAALSRIAAEDLRAAFFSAEMGVTGVNLGVAESGTLVLAENEGNIRLTTLLPRVLVSFMGIEKVVPDLWSAWNVLNLLAKNATGQRLPGYVSFLGPDWPGPGASIERHLVIVDGGRTGICADGAYRPVLWCVRCGACQNACPVYGRVGGHAYGHTYSGPIGICLAPLLSPGKDTAGLPYASSLCGACGEVCPVKIPMSAIILRHRALVFGSRHGAGVFERLAFRGWRFFMSGGFRYRLSLLFHRLGHRLLPALVNFVSGRLAWHDRRRLPPPAPRSFGQLWKKRGGGA